MQEEATANPSNQNPPNPHDNLKYAPTKEEFLIESARFPKGNPRNAYSLIIFAIQNWTTFEGKPVTWKMIQAKWSEYLNSVSERDPKYIKSFESFIRDRDYEGTFDIKNISGINKLMDKYTKEPKKKDDEQQPGI